MKAWQVVSFGRRILGKITLFIVGCIAMLKMGSTVAMAVSMVISILVYAVAFGLKFAIGFVILLLLHEWGHLAASTVVGLPASRPIFVPFIGAVIRIEELPLNAKMEANVAIGGPAMGTLSALVCLAFYLWTDSLLMLVLSYTACLLNLFNLIPCDPLDGGRIAVAISHRLWWLGSIIIGALFLYTYNFFLFIFFLFSLYRLWKNVDIKENFDYYHLTIGQRLAVGWWYFGLIIVLGITTLYIGGIFHGR
jgi:Zn-dependent protease